MNTTATDNSQPTTLFQRPAGKQPNVNTQKKTEDVTNTKGLTFNDFNLSQEVQLVSHCKCVPVGHL